MRMELGKGSIGELRQGPLRKARHWVRQHDASAKVARQKVQRLRVGDLATALHECRQREALQRDGIVALLVGDVRARVWRVSASV